MIKLISKAMAAVLLCFGGATQGQGHDSHWVFGNGFNIKFNEADPSVLPIIDNYFAFEGASSISTKTGELLFYSNTIGIWNRNSLPLFNSDTFPALDVPPSSSKTNGSLFLPWPGDSTDNYFAFFSMNDADDKLYYSKLDRSLGSGWGGIVDSIKYVSVWDNPVAEQLNAVRHGNGRDWWIVAQMGSTLFSNQFYLAKLTPEGIVDAGIQYSSFLGHITGSLIFNGTGSMMAVTHTYGNCTSSPSALALYNFDRCEGRIELIDTLVTRSCGQRAYGIAFSPDDNMMYYSTIEKTKVYQVSLVGDQLVDTLIFELGGAASFFIGGGGVLLGRDDKIYVNYRRAASSPDFDTIGKYLGVITSPNSFGLDCQYDTLGFYLGGQLNTGFSLPNFANYDLGPLVGSPCDTLSPQDTTQTSIEPVLPIQGEWSITPSISSGWYQLNSTNEGWLLVHDLYGREVVRQWFSGTTPFDLNALPAGLYVATVTIERGLELKVQRLLKQ